MRIYPQGLSIELQNIEPLFKLPEFKMEYIHLFQFYCAYCILTFRAAVKNHGFHKGWKTSLYTHFAPPHPCAMLTEILSFIKRLGNEGLAIIL